MFVQPVCYMKFVVWDKNLAICNGYISKIQIDIERPLVLVHLVLKKNGVIEKRVPQLNVVSS
jgi:hypothetical protein